MTTTSQARERTTLDKVVSFRSYISIGLGIIIGVGWVVYSGKWLSDGGPLGAMLAFLIGGLFLLPIGKCYAELTAAIPVAGGELAFSYKAFGPLIAFLTGWSLSLSYVTLTPFETIAIGTLFETIFPGLVSAPLYHVGGEHISWSTLLPGEMIGIYLVWLNYMGTKNSTLFQRIVVVGLFSCVALFTTIALFKGDISNLTPLFAQEGSFWAVAPASIISVLVVVPWFMSGFDAIPQVSEEAGLKLKPEQLGTAILTTIIVGSVFYVVIILAVSISMPWQISSKLPMATSEIFKVAFGYEWAAKIVLFAALLGLISTLNGMYIVASRLIFAMGRGGLLPHWFAVIDSKHHTPKNAILFVGAISLLGPFVGKSALSAIVNSSSLTFTTALFVTCLAAIRLRKTAPDMERPYKTGELTLYAGALVSAILILLMVLPQSSGQLAPKEFLIIISWLVLGYLAYIWRKRKDNMEASVQAEMILGKYN